jgi:glyoxylase-like metal-dependent hydrolase (beta-lactamase superfamily II)
MYNPGFGDCFLLALRAEDNSARYVLIDCGIHHCYPDAEAKMQLLARDIAEATGNHLHVVVVTHQHTDHLYGFRYGRGRFDGIDIDDLWLAWTEDPTDEDAKALREVYGMRIRALAAAVHQLRSSNAPLASALERVVGFDAPEALAAAGGNAAQLQYLRDKSVKKLEGPEDYRRPQEVLTLPGVAGVRFYVLGPPREKEWIRKLSKKSEMYHELRAMDEETAFAAAALAAGGPGFKADGDCELERRSRPFDPSLEIPKDMAPDQPAFGHFFREHYGFPMGEDSGPAWRRIDADWLAAAERLALNLNSKTNNTSLVLAIELTETEPRKVLLFAADAQVGSWLSWHELSWPGAGPDGATVTTADLLRRTVLYKVGHHGSHNATLKGKGLEMMGSPDLVAMIPVDQKWANEDMDWEHPADVLLGRLREKARGRVIRTDRIPSGNDIPEKPEEASQSQWDAFVRQLDWDRGPRKLWIQYTVTG